MTSWNPLGGGLVDLVDIADHKDGGLEVFARGWRDNAIYHIWQIAAGVYGLIANISLRLMASGRLSLVILMVGLMCLWQNNTSKVSITYSKSKELICQWEILNYP